MLLSLRWLGEWIDLPPEAELVERLTLAGIEIEGATRVGPDLGGIRVGHVRERRPHPNADRLSVCQVDVGEGAPREIVCGAPNVAAGQKVAVAVPGAQLPDGRVLEAAKLRGVVSNGMILSDREMGLSEEGEGIRVLDPGARVGAPLSEVLGVGDTVLDLAITPNRGDWVSVLGIAREVRAHFGGTLRIPPCDPPEAGPAPSRDLRVEIADADGCHRYVARVVRGVRVAPSPEWLRGRLEAAGLRPINNVVDVTNLVLLELGQPLHAFDLATLRGGMVRVRSAGRGEALVTLDGLARGLEPSDLVIADAERAIAVAGVMGGAETEVTAATADVFIESAHFHPTRVRRTARRLGISTDASYRFERGVDREGSRRAADRAARLLAEIAGGVVATGAIEVRGAAPPVTETILLDPARVNRLLGTALTPAEVAAYLARVDVPAAPEADGRLRCTVPSHRNDLHIAEDLIEEAARVHGYDRIEPTLPEGPLLAVQPPPGRQLVERARDALRSSGLTEVMTLGVLRAEAFDRLALPEGDPRRRTVQILNPILEGEVHLRTTLLPCLLEVARWNRARQVETLRLFEVSRVFRPRGGSDLPDEPIQTAALWIEGETPRFWESRSNTPLFFRAKGVAEALLADLDYEAGFSAGSAEPYLHPGAASTITVAGRIVGSVGELHPEVVARFELGVPCAVLEVDLRTLLELPPREIRFREVSRQPWVRRDLAVVLPEDVAAGEVLEAIRKTAGPELVSAEVFDRYQGPGVAEGRVSLAFRLRFQRPDRTLTDAEVARATDRVVQMLAHRFGGELR